MDYQAGSAWVPVKPAFSGFHREVAKEFGKLGPTIRKLGTEFGREFAQGLRTGMGDPISEPLRRDHEKQRKQAPRQGAEQGGAFAQGFRRSVQAALKNLPKAEIDGDSTDAQREIASVRAQLAALADKTVGVDLDAVQAMGELRVLQLRLDEIGEGADFTVRADTAQASAQLDALLRKLRELEGRDATIHVDAATIGAQTQLAATQQQADQLDNSDVDLRVDADTGAATAGMLALGVAAAGTMAIPVGAVLGAGLISMLGPLSAATAGFGALALVAVPSVGRIGEALKAQEQASTAAAGATTNLAQTQAQAQIQAMQMANAQAAVGQAQERAAEQQRAALDKVRSAEQSLTSAQRTARQAQDELTQARAQARRDAQDLALQVSGAALDQEESVLAVTAAENRLAEVRAAANVGRASATDVAGAELDVRQAQQTQKERELALKRLRQEQAASDKAGVDGSDQVRTARERLADANRRVSEQERNLARARSDVAKADRDGARAVEQARQQVRMMQLQQQAATAATTGGSAAMGKYADAMAELSPSARGLMGDWLNLRDAFTSWQTALEPTVLPLLGAGLRFVESRLSSLTPLVYGASAATGTLLRDLQAATQDEWWQGFGDRFAASVAPSTVSLGRSVGNVGAGMSGIVNAWLPYAPQMLASLEGITAQFAQWGKNLDGSERLEGFMAFVTQNAPGVREALGAIWDAVTHIVVSLAPLGMVTLGAFGAVASVIAQLPPEVLRGIAVGITGIVLATKAWQIASALLNSTMLTNPLGWVLLLIGALIGGVVWAYTEFDGFREVVNGVWESVSSGFGQFWNSTLKPGFLELVGYIRENIIPAVMDMWVNVFQPAFQAIGAVVMWVFQNVIIPVFKLYIAYVQNVVVPVAIWLWQKILAPAFQAIGAALLWVWQNVLKPTFALLVAVWQNVIAPVAMWLWRKIISPVFSGISLAVKIAWGILKIIFATIKWTISNVLGPVFLWLYNKMIKPAWDGIRFAISVVWNWIRDKVFKPMDSGAGRLGEAFQEARRVIKKAWQGIQDAAKAPARFLVEQVYMGAVKPMWDKVAGIVGADELPDVRLPRGFASGGILPGYTPGRDVHRFWSPTAGGLDLSGGETIFRPEVTRALGVSRVNEINAAARTGGVAGAARALGGSQAFADGGIFGGSTSGVNLPNIGDLLVDLASKGAQAFAGVGSWGSAVDVLVDPVKAALSTIGKTGLPGIPYMATGAVRDKLVDWLDDNGIGGGGGAEVGSAKGMPGRVLALARAAVGQYPEQPAGSNRNAITSWYGMHDQWCAMFISWLFAQAGSSGSLGRAKRTAWTGDYYGSGMDRVHGARRPGDVLVYGRRHVNLATGQRSTIGGNESNNVRASSNYGGNPAVFRPMWAPESRGYARGGIVPRGMLNASMMRRIGSQDDRTNPLIPAYNQGGWVGGLSGDRNLLLAERDEFVVRAQPAREHGAVLEAINSGHRLRDVLAASGHIGLSPTQQAALSDLANGRDGGSTVNAELHLHDGQATVREAFRELRHEVRRMDLEGRYGR